MNKSILAAAALAAGMWSTASQAVTVDLELSLLVDVSGSVNDSEFALQRDGYVNAFNDSSLWDAIDQGSIGQIAVNLVYFSTSSVQSVGWTLIDSFSASQSFAAAIAAATRPFSGNTGIAQGISFADALFDSNGFDGTRNVIDVSGDGTENVDSGGELLAARDAFCGQGGNYAINGIAIESASLQSYYANNVQCGTGSFTTFSSSFSDFNQAVRAKLQREIAPPPVPVPASLPLALTGIALLGGLSMKRKNRKA